MRRNILRLLGLSLAAVAVITYINWSGNRDAAAPNPAAQLHCPAGHHIAAANATTAPTTKETRTPAQLAAAWATSRSPDLIAGQHEVYTSDDRIDIGFDSKAQTVAVLTFRSHLKLGWHLDAVVACQPS